MTHRPTEPDHSRRPHEPSELYGSFVLKIDAEIADHGRSELNSNSLAGLSAEEAGRLDEARECLQRLYQSAHDQHRRHRASATTLLFDFAALQNDFSGGIAVNGHRVESERNHCPKLGRFEVIREIASGGHGVVFLARDPTLNRRVALKVPLPEALLTPSMRRRFLAEGRAAAILTHPNIVPVYEAGELGPIFYLAEAYVAGPTLTDWQQRHAGPVAPAVAAEIVAQIADGVEHAHDRGILHRDLKPGNVLLDMESIARGENSSSSGADSQRLDFIPKITDFGIAKSLASDGNETVAGMILGTPAYMSPEQAMGRSEHVGHASDVYSLGAILYELLTGQPVFHGETCVETVRMVTTTEATRPRTLRRDVPRDLEAICLKCLEKDPLRRYPSAFELAADLRRFLADQPTRARPITSREQFRRWCRRKPALAALIGVSIAATVILIANMLWSKHQLEELLVESNAQRERAESNEQLAIQREEIAREHVYASDMATAQEAWYSGSLSLTAEILAQHVPRPGQRDLRTLEWHYLTSLLSHSSQLLAGHTGRLGALGYSPDGKLLASGAADGTICLWDAITRQLVRTWNVPERKEVNAVAFSPDGRTLAVATDESKLRLWSVSSGEQIAVLEGHTGWVGDVCFSPDGKLLASAGSDKSVRLWDVATAKQLFLLPGHQDIVRCVRFLLDGALLASTSEDQTVRLWNVADGRVLVDVPLNSPAAPNQARPTSMAVSPDGKTLAVCLEASFVRTWRVTLPGNLEPINDLRNDEVRCIAFQRDGKSIVIGTNNAQIREWNLATNAIAHVRRGHRQQVLSIAASPTSEDFSSGARDGELRNWNSNSGQASQKLAAIPGIYSNIAVSSDGASLIVGGNSPKYFVVDAESGRVRHTDELPANDRNLYVGDWIVSIFNEKTIRIRDAATGQLRHEFPNEFAAVVRVAPSPDGTGLLVANQESLNLIELRTSRPRASLHLSSSVRYMTSAPDGKHLAIGLHDGQLLICDAADLRVVRKLSGHTDGITALAFSPTEPLICSKSDDYSARLWNWHSGEQLRTLASLEGRFGVNFFSRDGRTVVGRSSDEAVCTWNVHTGRKTLQIDVPGISDLAISADGRRCYVLRRPGNGTSEIDAIEFGPASR